MWIPPIFQRFPFGSMETTNYFSEVIKNCLVEEVLEKRKQTKFVKIAAIQKTIELKEKRKDSIESRLKPMAKGLF